MQILAQYEPDENWHRAVAQLKKLEYQPNAPRSLSYNVAQLLTVHSQKATGYWKFLASQAKFLPDPIRAVVCRQANCSNSIRSRRTLHTPWIWPVPFKWQRLSEQTQVMSKLKSWQKPISFSFNNQLNGHIYQSTDKRTTVLELDDYMQMQIIKGNHLGTVKALQNYCGQLRPRTLARGVLWSCDDWAALTFEGEVREIWRVLR